MKFVTEELWQALPNRREALIISFWPQTSLPRSTDLTRAIRNAIAEYSVEPAKRITASIVGSEEVIQYISEEKEVLALLSKLDLDNIHFNNEMAKKKNPLVYMDVSIDGDPAEIMVFELFPDIAPKTAENFRALCTEDKSGAGIRIHDNNEGEESTVVRFEGEVSLGDLIWLKLLGKTWWPTVVCLWLFDLATSSFFRPFKD
ncbi:hypothetical protein GOBAR_DD11460 [Gossypium barbadense]|nr:hypothetical protein GOBAR_DD11460 [Gossypium barbadense]